MLEPHRHHAILAASVRPELRPTATFRRLHVVTNCPYTDIVSHTQRRTKPFSPTHATQRPRTQSMKTLLGIGGSDDSLRALEETARRAKSAGDDLTVAIVENPESDRGPDEVRTAVEDVLTETDLEASVRHVSGDPGSRLVEIAETEDFDHIVIGGGQRSPMGKIQLGHITEFVLLNSHVTVTLVR